jgi:hypothetical protein
MIALFVPLEDGVAMVALLAMHVKQGDLLKMMATRTRHMIV